MGRLFYFLKDYVLSSLMPLKPGYVFLVLLPLLSISCDKPSFNEDAFRTSTAEIDLDSIKKRGYINVIIDNNSLSYFIYKGEPMGYDYELLKLFAASIHVDLKLKISRGIGKSINKLNRGDADIMAFPLTITKERRKYIAFTRPHYNSYQVLVQRKPRNWRRLTQDQITDSLIRNPVDLIGKEIHLLRHSSFVPRLENLSEEIGGDIIIKEDTVDAETESYIKRVSSGEIDYTVADHTIAAVNAAYYPNIDVKTILSLPQQIAWGTRKNSPALLEALNTWLDLLKREPTFMVIYNRYYKSPRTYRMRMNSDYSSMGGNRLSRYDEWIKEGAKSLGWDWRLLAALIYQESRFEVDDESWAGAQGLMQLMPQTAKRFGATDANDPHQSILAGCKYLKYLDRYWTKKIENPTERIKFVLASYNAGLGHVLDAYRLAAKQEADSLHWENHVADFLLKKSDFRQDEVVTAGFCKCEEPVNYVREVLVRYEQYKSHIPVE